MRCPSAILLAVLSFALLVTASSAPVAGDGAKAEAFQVYPIGYIRKTDGKTTIVLEKAYEPALLGMEPQRDIWVIWWFDRNDTPEMRSILQVHPRADPANPLTGVFSTRAPVRPNLIALTRCTVLSVKGNVIEIDGIDAYPDTPVLDIKRVIEAAY